MPLILPTLLRLRVSPDLADDLEISLVEVRGTTEYRLMCSGFRPQGRGEGIEHLAHPHDIWQCDIEKHEARTQLATLENLAIGIAPVFVDPLKGRSFGGAFYQFTSYRNGASIQLEWADPVPDEWQIADEVARWMIEKAKQSAPESHLRSEQWWRRKTY